MTTPTLNEMLHYYIESAAVERLKCGRPSEGTVKNTRIGVKKFLKWAEFIAQTAESCDDLHNLRSVTAEFVTPRTLRKYLAFLLSSGVKPVSSASFVNQLQQLFARWVRPYYEDRGWAVPTFPTLTRRAKCPRYSRPSHDMLAKVKDWYHSLPPTMLWYAATMMLEFGMRNGDILRLTRQNFVDIPSGNGSVQHYLNYTPHKTAHSSGRVVRWPIHKDIWELLELVQPWNKHITNTIFERLNIEMRSLGFTGTKGAYELRKICVDHIYQKYGAEMAVSISGDDIKTISRYYADPAQPNFGEMRVIDLF